MPEVLNKHHGPKDGAAVDSVVYIGRGSKWGNPFVIGKDGTREEVIEEYRRYLHGTTLMEQVYQLRGKDLVCYCAPLPCHADVLLSLANL